MGGVSGKGWEGKSRGNEGGVRAQSWCWATVKKSIIYTVSWVVVVNIWVMCLKGGVPVGVHCSCRQAAPVVIVVATY